MRFCVCVVYAYVCICVCVCARVCTGVHTHVYVSMEARLMLWCWVSSSMFFTLRLEVGSLIEPGAHGFDNSRWPVTPRGLPVSASSELELLEYNHCLTFYVGSGNLNSVFRLLWHYWLIHLFIPKVFYFYESLFFWFGHLLLSALKSNSWTLACTPSNNSIAILCTWLIGVTRFPSKRGYKVHV